DAPPGHGCRGLPDRIDGQRDPCAAPGAPAGSVERGSLRTTAGTGRGTWAGQTHHATPDPPVPPETVPGQPQRFPRSIGDHRTADDERRVATPADAARRRLRHRTHGAPE